MDGEIRLGEKLNQWCTGKIGDDETTLAGKTRKPLLGKAENEPKEKRQTEDTIDDDVNDAHINNKWNPVFSSYILRMCRP